MNEKIIVWKKNILATVKNIRRKLWVTKSDLIELINSIDKFFDKEVKRTDSKNIEFLKKIRNNESEIYKESNKIKGIKSSQTKQKNRLIN